MLDDFAKVIGDNHSDAVVMVEGFADPAGSTAFNRRVSLVIDYVGTGKVYVLGTSLNYCRPPAGAGSR